MQVRTGQRGDTVGKQDAVGSTQDQPYRKEECTPEDPSPEEKRRKCRDKDQDGVIDEDLRAVMKKRSGLGERSTGHPFDREVEYEACKELQHDCVSIAQSQDAFPQ